MDYCKNCAMPLTKVEDHCSCKPELCYHCCTCGDSCKCGCSKKEVENKPKGGCCGCKKN